MSKTTTYLVKGAAKERLSTENLAKIPGVEISSRETRDLVKKTKAPSPTRRTGTRQLPFMNPAQAQASASGTYSRAEVTTGRKTAGIGIDESLAAAELEPEGATFRPPWSPSSREMPAYGRHQSGERPAAGHGTPQTERPSARPTQGVPVQVKPAPTTRQAFALVEYLAGSESITLPGVATAAHLPRVRIEHVFATFDEAYAEAARLNRAHAATGKVYAVNAVAIPVGL